MIFIKKDIESIDDDLPLLLTPKQAAKYTGIGVDTLREISDKKDCKFVLFVKSHRRYKRKELEKYIEETKYID